MKAYSVNLMEEWVDREYAKRYSWWEQLILAFNTPRRNEVLFNLRAEWNRNAKKARPVMMARMMARDTIEPSS